MGFNLCLWVLITEVLIWLSLDVFHCRCRKPHRISTAAASMHCPCRTRPQHRARTHAAAKSTQQLMLRAIPHVQDPWLRLVLRNQKAIKTRLLIERRSCAPCYGDSCHRANVNVAKTSSLPGGPLSATHPMIPSRNRRQRSDADVQQHGGPRHSAITSAEKRARVEGRTPQPGARARCPGWPCHAACPPSADPRPRPPSPSSRKPHP